MRHNPYKENIHEQASDWEQALEKIKQCAIHPSPIAVATLNQDECNALIVGIMDAFRMVKR